MLKQRTNAVESVRARFLEAELAQDDAAINAARCVVEALEQRRAANLPIGTGVEVIQRLSRAAQLSIEARTELVLAHPELAKLPAEIGLTHMYGDGDECPEWSRPAGKIVPLVKAA